MKRYNGLYQTIYDMQNIRLAHCNARKRKGRYAEVKMVDTDPETYFQTIHNLLKNKAFVNSPYEIFLRHEKGKTREIYKLPYYPARMC